MHACIHASTPKMHQNIRIVLDGLHSQKKVRCVWVGRGFRTCTEHLSQPGREVHHLFIVLVEREDTPTFWCYPFTSADSILLEETASPFWYYPFAFADSILLEETASPFWCYPFTSDSILLE